MREPRVIFTNAAGSPRLRGGRIHSAAPGTLAPSDEPRLAPRLVDRDRDRVREVEAAHRRLHGDAHARALGEPGENLGRQSRSLAAEDKDVVDAELASEKRSPG